MAKLWATAPVDGVEGVEVATPDRPHQAAGHDGRALGRPLAAVHDAVGALEVTRTAWTPLLHGTNRVPLRSAEPPSEKQKPLVRLTWPPTPPRLD